MTLFCGAPGRRATIGLRRHALPDKALVCRFADLAGGDDRVAARTRGTPHAGVGVHASPPPGSPATRAKRVPAGFR
ncbi:MAG TPA: hypothetical protein PK089_01265 [Methanoregulaceae archaeon]|nr:hypothetical protein [Methanoregulaceae archaeon]HQJ87410.1 hypothetical protein [Methanoregulaceae archaeon]